LTGERAPGGGFDHDHCLLCGQRNPLSLRLRFEAAETGDVSARFRPSRRLQGYRGVLHGGVISALLDSAMTHCLFHRGIRAVTGDLYVRFLAPVSCDGELELGAWVVAETPPVYRLEARIVQDGKTVARARARFMESGRTRCRRPKRI
jgi:uncharacterized protein (TIGR00369 family)